MPYNVLYDLPYKKDYVDYKSLRKHDYYNLGRVYAINALSTIELVEYFVKVIAESYSHLNFTLIDRGDYELELQCNDKCLYRGSYIDVEKLFRQSSDLFLNTLKEKLE